MPKRIDLDIEMLSAAPAKVLEAAASDPELLPISIGLVCQVVLAIVELDDSDRAEDELALGPVVVDDLDITMLPIEPLYMCELSFASELVISPMIGCNLEGLAVELDGSGRVEVELLVVGSTTVVETGGITVDRFDSGMLVSTAMRSRGDTVDSVVVVNISVVATSLRVVLSSMGFSSANSFAEPVSLLPKGKKLAIHSA